MKIPYELLFPIAFTKTILECFRVRKAPQQNFKRPYN
ncbi:hypothetical protein LSS_23005 [Leptospira santarosai serovar Shermani str. LT 821]|uniref:Uncharacterized protein n=1 Tax=Leptospira santarosai serovar Shermani str. LT 821 TaxID=758847 RepID=A0A097ESZ5_9LEPT|nr:hypothetical protein LSS_23005 [Leptospira santarosai serovar Shermani str. LT 821]